MQINEFRENIIPLSNRLLRFAGCFLKNEEDAKDTVQDVLLKLWQKRESLANVKNIEAFSMQMTRNLCLDKIKAQKPVRLNSEADLKINRFMEMYDATEWEDTANHVKRLIGKLPEQQKSVIFLRDVEQMEFSEIGKITGMELNAVRVNLSRARKQVRDELLKNWENEERRSENIAAKVFRG
jgi:RNA polymerase sigma factor (sigma-70 family)